LRKWEIVVRGCRELIGVCVCVCVCVCFSGERAMVGSD
jgi:hypothetical protein